jgi:hypothetical protein
MAEAETIYEALDRIEASAVALPQAELVVPPNATPLEFFRAVYLDPAQPPQRRMRAAEAAAPYMHPKLAVVAQVDGIGWASKLEDAIVKSGKAVVIGAERPALPKPD